MFAKMLRSVSWLVAFALMFTLAACASSEAGDEQTETTTVSTATQSSVTTATQPSVTTSAQTSAETTTVEVEENPFEEFYEISWIFGFCDTYEEGAYDELFVPFLILTFKANAQRNAFIAPLGIPSVSKGKITSRSSSGKSYFITSA